MINSFLSLNLAFTVVVFISTLFLFIGIFYSRKKVSLNTYLVSDRNEGVFSLSATLIASSLAHGYYLDHQPLQHGAVLGLLLAMH
jgi:Na+/proline symporter